MQAELCGTRAYDPSLSYGGQASVTRRLEGRYTKTRDTLQMCIDEVALLEWKLAEEGVKVPWTSFQST